jgi:hypothetical protein
MLKYNSVVFQHIDIQEGKGRRPTILLFGITQVLNIAYLALYTNQKQLGWPHSFDPCTGFQALFLFSFSRGHNG